MPPGDDATEGDGYLLALINDWDTVLSDLLILDTANPPHGPWGPEHLVQAPQPAHEILRDHPAVPTSAVSVRGTVTVTVPRTLARSSRLGRMSVDLLVQG